MAMQRPHARIICIPLQHHVTRHIRRTGLQQVHVAPLRVGRVRDVAVPVPESFGQDPRVVPVQVDGVHGGEEVAHHDADRGRGAEVVNVPFGVVGVGGVAAGGEEERRSAVEEN